MRPAFSIIFLTTLVGAAQGLFLAMYAAQLLARASKAFFVFGSAASVMLAALGLVASFLPDRPDKARRWRACLFIALVAAYGGMHYHAREGTLWIGALGVAACVALCFRGAIAGFFLMGTASGFTLAVPLAGLHAPHLLRAYALASMALTAVALAARLAALNSNAGQPVEALRRVRFAFIVLGFIAPILLVHLGVRAGMFEFLAAAFLVQYVGLAMERWFFLAQANPPRNPNHPNMT